MCTHSLACGKRNGSLGKQCRGEVNGALRELKSRNATFTARKVSVYRAKDSAYYTQVYVYQANGTTSTVDSAQDVRNRQ